MQRNSVQSDTTLMLSAAERAGSEVYETRRRRVTMTFEDIFLFLAIILVNSSRPARERLSRPLTSFKQAQLTGTAFIAHRQFAGTDFSALITSTIQQAWLLDNTDAVKTLT